MNLINQATNYMDSRNFFGDIIAVNLSGKQRQDEELPASLLFSLGGKLEAPSTQACPLGPSCHLVGSSQPQLGSLQPSLPPSIPSCHPPLTIHLIHLSETSQQFTRSCG